MAVQPNVIDGTPKKNGFRLCKRKTLDHDFWKIVNVYGIGTDGATRAETLGDEEDDIFLCDFNEYIWSELIERPSLEPE